MAKPGARLKVWRRYFVPVLAVVAAGAALGVPGWYYFRPRTIDVCVVSDYSFRQQRGDWRNLLDSRFQAVNEIFSGTGVRWRFFHAGEPDPTGTLHGVELRRRRLAHAECTADIVLAVTGQPEGEEAGDVVPFAHTAIIVDSPKLSEERNVQAFAHGMAALFGAPADPKGAGTLMTLPPEGSTLPSSDRKLIRRLRGFRFREGTGILGGDWGGTAQGALESAWAGRSGNPLSQAHRTLGLALAADENFKPAIAHLREAARLDPYGPQAHEELAAVLSHDSQYPQAIAEYREAVRSRPDSPELHAALAMALANGGRGDEAIDEFTTALHMRPLFPTAQAAMAYVLSQHLGCIDQSIEAYRKALEMRPGMEQAAEGLERALAIKAAAVEAIPARRKRAQDAPSNPVVHFDLALAEARAGNIDNAIQEFRKTIALEARNHRAHSNLALLLYARKDYAGAQSEARAARDAGGNPPADLLDVEKRKGG
jgi:tetratricopeptide (TPR) repeat protein